MFDTFQVVQDFRNKNSMYFCSFVLKNSSKKISPALSETNPMDQGIGESLLASCTFNVLRLDFTQLRYSETLSEPVKPCVCMPLY